MDSHSIASVRIQCGQDKHTWMCVILHPACLGQVTLGKLQ